MKKNAVIKDSLQGLDLTQEQIDLMKEQFYLLDKQKAGTINSFETYSLFEALGEFLTRERSNQLQEWIESKSASKRFDINVALRAWSYLKELNLKDEEDDFDIDILNTFIAMGGNTDKTGVVKKQRLVEIITTEFGLTIDIEMMFEEAGIDSDKDLEFADFVCLLESGGSQRASRICSIFSIASY